MKEMVYRVELGCYGERIVADEDEALEFVRMHYPNGEIWSIADVDDPAIGETPIYETADLSDTFAIGTIYPHGRDD